MKEQLNIIQKDIPKQKSVQIDLQKLHDNLYPFKAVVPGILDLEVTGACPYRCEWCWGPDHQIHKGLTTKDYHTITQSFSSLGTERFVITGGEPLLRNDLAEIIDGVPRSFFNYQDNQEEAIGVTLSTSGARFLDKDFKLTQFSNVLDSLARRESSEIGLPLDGPNQFVNAMMRPTATSRDKERNFYQVIELIKILQQTSRYQDISVKLRTVATAKNQYDISAIPDTLQEYGIDLSRIAWQIYQVNPYVGERIEDVKANSWEISDQRFSILQNKVEKHSKRFNKINYKYAKNSADRYCFVSPNGDIRTIKNNFDGYPTDYLLGNLVDQPHETLMNLSDPGVLPWNALKEEDRLYLGQMLRL